MIRHVLLSALFLLALAPAAAAHERVQAGPVSMSVGWAAEPAYAGNLNAVQVVVRQGDQPVRDLAAGALKVEVTFGDKKTGVMPLEASFGETFGTPGDYRADLIPTAAGPYTFHVTGDVRGTAIDQIITSGETTFDSPKEPSEAQFPTKEAKVSNVATMAQRLQLRFEDLRDRSEAGINRAQALGMAGLGLGAVALLVSLLGLRKR